MLLSLTRVWKSKLLPFLHLLIFKLYSKIHFLLNKDCLAAAALAQLSGPSVFLKDPGTIPTPFAEVTFSSFRPSGVVPQDHCGASNNGEQLPHDVTTGSRRGHVGTGGGFTCLISVFSIWICSAFILEDCKIPLFLCRKLFDLLYPCSLPSFFFKNTFPIVSILLYITCPSIPKVTLAVCNVRWNFFFL